MHSLYNVTVLLMGLSPKEFNAKVVELDGQHPKCGGRRNWQLAIQEDGTVLIGERCEQCGGSFSVQLLS